MAMKLHSQTLIMDGAESVVLEIDPYDHTDRAPAPSDHTYTLVVGDELALVLPADEGHRETFLAYLANAINEVRAASAAIAERPLKTL
ncbi:hypothetical protein ACIBKX_40405 [Streptomyces sp. NPDC050658]|uniref:hypothetical protein n=1 Tax=unclassified Streptomyces TaxID=2593676 RepID=UPI0034291A86